MTRVDMEQLIRHLSHEVKNPLTTLKGYSQLASLKKNDPEFIDKALGVISSQVERIEKIFNDLYAVFFYQKGSLADCNIESILKKILESTESAAISLQISSDLSVNTDEKLFYRLLSLVVSGFDWEAHPAVNCNVSALRESERILIMWDFKNVDFTDIRKKLFFMPFSDKNYYPSGISLYESFCIADILGFSFTIDPARNRFILETR
jgi:light-regulated signal transduction histidine kinase (bacteriophytochrome)